MSIKMNALATMIQSQKIEISLAYLLVWSSKQQEVWINTSRVMSLCFKAQSCQSRDFDWSLWSVNKICLQKRKETWSWRVEYSCLILSSFFINMCRKLFNSWHCIFHQICINLLTSQSLNIYSCIKTSSIDENEAIQTLLIVTKRVGME